VHRILYMNRTIVYHSPSSVIPPRTIVLWDAKYRKDGGSYPVTLAPSKVARWSKEIQAALNSPMQPVIGRISGPRLSHINATIAEFNAYQLLCANGHIGIREPGRPTAVDANFITYFHGSPITQNIDIQTAMANALSSGSIVGRIFRWPSCVVSG
jgi:hypothetical protein